VSTLGVARENFLAAESRIRDVDVAAESAELTRLSILQQAGASVLAQANQAPALALSLLG
jgi:flagellin